MKKFITRAVIGTAFVLAATAGQAQDAKPASPAPAATVKAAPGYLISSFIVRDQATFQKYLDAVGPISTKYKGKVTAFNVNARTVEGTPRPMMAVVEFPSYADVERFYFSPEYTEVKKLRIASTEGFVPPQQ